MKTFYMVIKQEKKIERQTDPAANIYCATTSVWNTNRSTGANKAGPVQFKARWS